MRETYLVQRLGQPPKSQFLARAEQVFGGGMLQLSAEAWKILQSIFSIDYMGAAEYEFGALPKSLQAFLKDQSDLESYVLMLRPNEIKPNWMRESAARDARRKELAAAKTEGKRAKKAKPLKGPNKETPVYVLCRKQHWEEVANRIKLLALDQLRTKEGSRFSQALDPFSEYDSKICGWYELDNGFFFFTDRVMWEKTVRLFKDGEYDDKVLEEK